MKHVKTLNSSTLKESMKKGGCGECQIPASQPARHPVQWATRAVRTAIDSMPEYEADE